jgi:hypothetical protein
MSKLGLITSSAIIALGVSVAHADVITGDLRIGGFTTTNLYDPHNSLVPNTVPTSAYTIYSNSSSPTVIVTNYPITFGFNCSSCSDFFSIDTTTFTGNSFTYEEFPNNGEQASRSITFTSSPGYFDNFIVLFDGFNNGGISSSVNSNGSSVILTWSGGLVLGGPNAFTASFAGTSAAPVPGPELGAGIPGALGLIGLAWVMTRR